MKYLLFLTLVAACSFDDSAVQSDGGPDSAVAHPDAPGQTVDAPGSAIDAPAIDAPAIDASSTDSFIDLDQDGLDDGEEDRIAHDYLPFLSVDPTDNCPLSGIVYRLRPHPMAPATRLHMIVDVMYQADCGAGGHAGDDEVFGLTIDPSRPAPGGILAVRAIAHQNTACQHVSDCGSCSGLTACTTATRNGAAYPVVFASKDKHGNYMSDSECDNACFFTNYCTLAPASAAPPMVNAGEPGAPMTRNLTTSGFITSANGWTDSSLMNFDPWGNTNFGGAGNVTSDLTDDSFLTDICQ
jgi:hypothetical protein